MKIQPLIVGSGNAGKAVAKSLAIVGIQDPGLEILKPYWVKRDESLNEVPRGEHSLLCITNPHGLHAKWVKSAAELGFSPIVVDKPAAISPEQIQSLRQISTPVLVTHGYRQMWGPQTLRHLIEAGELGKIFSIEGTYWQSSAAQRVFSLASSTKNNGWKNDVALNGVHDVLVDLGAHWADLMIFLLGELPKKAQGWLAYPNAESSHRDTHVHLTMEMDSGTRTFGSISKAVHGAGNDLHISILGEKQSASWTFASPDRICLGRGSLSTQLTRSDMTLGSQQSPFHATGWLEGYVEILRQAVRILAGQTPTNYPTLSDNLNVMEILLRIGSSPNFTWERNK